MPSFIIIWNIVFVIILFGGIIWGDLLSDRVLRLDDPPPDSPVDSEEYIEWEGRETKRKRAMIVAILLIIWIIIGNWPL